MLLVCHMLPSTKGSANLGRGLAKALVSVWTSIGGVVVVLQCKVCVGTCSFKSSADALSNCCATRKKVRYCDNTWARTIKCPSGFNGPLKRLMV